MKKLLSWFDRNILTIFSFFLIGFIPLYPKIPVLELIPGYIVRVRLEDFFILFAFFIFLLQVLRKKAKFKTIIFWPMIIYLGIGLLSILSAMFITRSIPLNLLHIGKMLLHWVRRIEYFSVFYIFYNGINNLKSFKKFTTWLLFILIALAIYGYGQKYLYWPVFSTMNREFSKGIKLYLTEHARVPSTFGGHYDLAAFLIIFLTLFTSFFLLVKNKFVKFLFIIGFLFSYWLLILTASRTSFIGYLVALTILMLILGLKKNIRWAIPRYLTILFLSMLIMLFFGDLSQRFAHFFNMPKIKETLGINIILKPFRAPPPNSIALNEDVQLVMDRTDERPVESKPKPSGGISGGIETNLPPDVYENLPDFREASKTATLAGRIIDATGASRLVVVPRSFSENAYKYGLSTAIRLDALWPWAIEAFKTNPLLGTGYSTLNKSSLGDFTEAESTDNDYLRSLGETGLLGFLSFAVIIFLVLKTALQSLKKPKDNLVFAYTVSFIAFTVGLLINAFYIDVFEASKVALTFWALTGVLFALQNLPAEKSYVKSKKAKNEN